MSNQLEYVLSLRDKISGNLQKIGVTSDTALDKFSKLQLQATKVGRSLNDMKGSVGSLREKLALLHAEKEWIPASNLTSIRKYNTEIHNLEKRILHLDTINGSVFKRNLKDAVSNIPFANFLTNPITLAGGAMFKAGKAALDFDEGMAKINTTAKLAPDKLKEVRTQLRQIGVDAGADLSKVPDSFEKILSQVGDTDLSLDILKTTLKGAKAGFTDADVVGSALANTLSLVGSQNTTAAEVMDTFQAAKDLGGAEMGDMANYLPQLISGGKALGIGFKDVAGLFSYMTAKGNDATSSTTLLSNAFSALGKVDIQKSLKTEGIQVFDKNGTMRQMEDIFSDLDKKMKGMSDEDKSGFLSKIGLVDKEAKNAFMVLASDNKKLSETMDGTRNSAGALDDAVNNSSNSLQNMRAAWSKIQNILITLGDLIIPIINPAFSALSAILTGISFVITPLFGLISGFFNALASGNIWVVAMTTAIAALTMALYWNKIQVIGTIFWIKAQDVWLNLWIAKENAMNLVMKGKAMIMGMVTSATWLWFTAQNALNWAMSLNPITWVVLAVIALIAVIIFVATKTEGWGNLWKHTVNGMKYAFLTYVEYIKFAFNTFVNGFMIGINKIQEAYYGFKNAIGLGDKKENNDAIARIQEDTERRKTEIKQGAVKLKDLAVKSATEFGLAATSLSMKKGGSIKETKDQLLGTLGVAAPGTPGANKIEDPKGPLKPGEKPAGDNKELSKTNSATATGGTKNTQVYLNFKNLIESLTVTGKDFKEGAKEIEQQATDALLRTLAMANLAGS